MSDIKTTFQTHYFFLLKLNYATFGAQLLKTADLRRNIVVGLLFSVYEECITQILGYSAAGIDPADLKWSQGKPFLSSLIICDKTTAHCI